MKITMHEQFMVHSLWLMVYSTFFEILNPKSETRNRKSELRLFNTIVVMLVALLNSYFSFKIIPYLLTAIRCYEKIF